MLLFLFLLLLLDDNIVVNIQICYCCLYIFMFKNFKVHFIWLYIFFFFNVSITMEVNLHLDWIENNQYPLPFLFWVLKYPTMIWRKIYKNINKKRKRKIFENLCFLCWRFFFLVCVKRGHIFGCNKITQVIYVSFIKKKEQEKCKQKNYQPTAT